jgi:hypothetical protein
MKAVFEVEHQRGRTFLVTCEVPLAKHEVEAAERNLRRQPGVKKVYMIGLFDEVMTYARNEILNETLFNA